MITVFVNVPRDGPKTFQFRTGLSETWPSIDYTMIEKLLGVLEPLVEVACLPVRVVVRDHHLVEKRVMINPGTWKIGETALRDMEAKARLGAEHSK